MISIIIPTFNRGNTIKRSIESVLNQTYKDIEVVVIDDCSTDNTYEIIKEIKDRRIYYYKNKNNLGACFSRNFGVSIARGEYIAFQDSDDEWLPGKLNEQEKFLNEMTCDIVFCSMLRISEKKKEIYPPYTPDNTSDLYRQLLIENCISTQTVFGKREAFEKTKFDERMPRFQDWELMLRMSRIYNIKYLNKVLVRSFIQKNSISINPKSAITALNIIYKNHYEEIVADNKINAIFHLKLAEYMLAHGENPKSYYKRTYELDFSIKMFLFYLICIFSLHKELFFVKKNVSVIIKSF